MDLSEIRILLTDRPVSAVLRSVHSNIRLALSPGKESGLPCIHSAGSDLAIF